MLESFWKNCKSKYLQLHQKGRRHRCFPVNSFCEYVFFGSLYSSIRSDICKVGLLKNFGKVTGKHLCRSFFFLIKLHAIKHVTLLKIVFSADFLLWILQNCSPWLKAPCGTPPVSACDFNGTFLTLRPRKTYIYVFPALLFLIFLSQFMFLETNPFVSTLNFESNKLFSWRFNVLVFCCAASFSKILNWSGLSKG